MVINEKAMKRNILKIAYYIGLCLIPFLTHSCKDDHFLGIVENNSNGPSPVSNVEVENGHGKARIRYTLPAEDDLLYVKAQYPLPNGQMRIIKASHYVNELVVDGFKDTSPYEIQLIAVNKSEKESAPVAVTIQPKTPVFQLVYDALEVAPTFGGVRMQSLNELKEDVVIVPMVDSLGTGEYVPLDSYYTEDSLINYSVRGLKPNEMNFAFYVRDRWLNSSDTLFTSLTPLEENLLDRHLFQGLRLPGDAEFMYGTTMEMLWDGNMTPGKWPSLYTVESAGAPQSLTFSLGKEAQLSRVVIFPRRENGFYDKGNLRDFEVWASNNPALDGSWDSWTKLAVCHVVKPSGTPPGTNTGADEAAGIAGWSFDMPEDAPKYKYLRIRNLRNWRGSYFIQINQINVWGVY